MCAIALLRRIWLPVLRPYANCRGISLDELVDSIRRYTKRVVGACPLGTLKAKGYPLGALTQGGTGRSGGKSPMRALGVRCTHLGSIEGPMVIARLC